MSESSASNPSTEYNQEEHTLEMKKYHEEQLQECLGLYHETSAQVKKHQVMLEYYNNQLK